VDFMLVAEQPWKRIADPANSSIVGSVLYNASECIRLASILAHPVIPDATQRIWEQLGQEGKLADQYIDQLQWGGLKPGTRIGKPEGVFPRADKKETLEKIETMENELRNPGFAAVEPEPSAPPTTEADVPTPSGAAPAAATTAAAPAAVPAVPAKIGIEDFAKVELRVGLVKSAERIQGADKLLKLLVDIGDEVRQVLAGIAMGYTPEELVGRKVVVVTNLAPRKMRGLESNGMLLAASAGPDGKPILCTFAEDIPVGSKVK
jgi:methionyl-tRNA synthetase